MIRRLPLMAGLALRQIPHPVDPRSPRRRPRRVTPAPAPPSPNGGQGNPGGTYRLMYAAALLYTAATLYRRREEVRDVWVAMVADARLRNRAGGR